MNESTSSQSDETLDRLVAEAVQTRTAANARGQTLFDRLRAFDALLSALPAAPSGPALLYREPGAAVRVFPLTGQATIGRDPGCDLAFPQKKALSRQHCSIADEAGVFVLRDHGSSNGLFVNGRATRVKEHALVSGDSFIAGGLIFFFAGPGER